MRLDFSAIINMTHPPAIVFTDFDGTVTLQDSNDYLTENIGFGRPARLAVNDLILNGEKSFRQGFQEMLDSVTTPLQECIELLLNNIDLDPGFVDFYKWCESQQIPIVVVSSGMKPIIEALLAKLVGKQALENIEILSNDLKINDDNTWDIIFKDDSCFGHDKSQSIRQYLADNNYNSSNVPLMFYSGDGVSDISAAKETNLLLAKHGKDLIIYCKRDGIPYTEFNNFNDIHYKIKAIVADNGKNIDDFIENDK